MSEKKSKYVTIPNVPTDEIIAAMAAVYDPAWGYPAGSDVDQIWARKSYEVIVAKIVGASPLEDRVAVLEAENNRLTHVILDQGFIIRKQIETIHSIHEDGTKKSND